VDRRGFARNGGGAGDIQDITAMGTRTVTTDTAMAIRTDTAATDTAAMVTEGMDTVTTATVTAMAMATILVASTAPPLILG